MKTLGIIGGLGPMATAYFLELLTGMTDVVCDQEHIPLVLQNIPQTPDRTAYILDHQEQNPLMSIVTAGKNLKQLGAQYIVIPCVTAHYFYQKLCQEIELPILSLIETTTEYFMEKGIKRIALLATSGTITSGILQQSLNHKGICTILPNDKQQQIIMQIIYEQVKAGKTIAIEDFEQIGDELRRQGAEKLLLGCTELSLIKRDFQLNGDYVDMLEILAAAAISYNGLQVKEYHRQIQEIK